MHMRILMAIIIAVSAVGPGCGSTTPPPPIDGGAVGDGGIASDGGPAGDGGTEDKAAHCASEFGSELTAAFGRVDGVVEAVVPPAHPTCPMPNDDHVVVQVRMNGAVYRMVLNVISSFGPDFRIRHGEVTAALPAPAWSEGWHPGLDLDYATTLGVHSGAAPFAPYEMADVVARVMEVIQVGEPISVYAHSSGGTFSHSTHKIHRNNTGGDGAIVLDPTSANPRFLLFHFADQSF